MRRVPSKAVTMTKAEAVRIMQTRNSPEDRFMLRAIAITESHGGLPTATIEAGRMVFTYPDQRDSLGKRLAETTQQTEEQTS